MCPETGRDQVSGGEVKNVKQMLLELVDTMKHPLGHLVEGEDGRK
jgi:hypothetical protein